MALTLVGTQVASATTITPPAHQVGDMIVIFAFRGASATIPTIGAGFTPILTKAGTGCGARLGCRVATSTSDTSGTWTNASMLACHVWRPSSGYVVGIGASASVAQTTLSVNFPALTLGDGYSGNTWAGGFIGVNNATQICTVAPTGMTNESTLVGTYSIAGFDTEGGVTSWSSTNATDTGTAGNSISCTFELNLMPGSPQPSQVVQHIGGGSQPGNQGLTGNAFKLPLTNPSRAGNCLVLGVTYDHGLTVTVSDNVNGAWGAAVTSASNSSASSDSRVYVFSNSAAGVTAITVTFNTTTVSFQSAYTEFSGIDNSSSAGSSSTAYALGPTCTAGSFTPTNNDSTGGNLIWVYTAEATFSGSHQCTNIRAGQNFILLDADIGWATATASACYHASASYVQTTSAAINPNINMIGCTDRFNTCAVALKLNSANGTARAAGINVIRICHFTTFVFPAAAATAIYTLQTPVVGNLRVLACDDPNVSSTAVITDNEGGTYTVTGGAGIGGGIWYRANTTSNSDLCITIRGGGADNRLSWRIYDVIGAAVAPFDNASSVYDSAGTTYTQSTSPTPTTGNGVVISNIGLGQGPGLSITSPSGAAFVLCTYTGETDFDVIEDADLSAVYYYSSNSPETWTWDCAVATSTSGGFAIFAAGTATLAFAARTEALVRASVSPSLNTNLAGRFQTMTFLSGITGGATHLAVAAITMTMGMARGAVSLATSISSKTSSLLRVSGSTALVAAISAKIHAFSTMNLSYGVGLSGLTKSIAVAHGAVSLATSISSKISLLLRVSGSTALVAAISAKVHAFSAMNLSYGVGLSGLTKSIAVAKSSVSLVTTIASRTSTNVQSRVAYGLGFAARIITTTRGAISPSLRTSVAGAVNSINIMTRSSASPSLRTILAGATYVTTYLRGSYGGAALLALAASVKAISFITSSAASLAMGLGARTKFTTRGAVSPLLHTTLTGATGVTSSARSKVSLASILTSRLTAIVGLLGHVSYGLGFAARIVTTARGAVSPLLHTTLTGATGVTSSVRSKVSLASILTSRLTAIVGMSGMLRGGTIFLTLAAAINVISFARVTPSFANNLAARLIGTLQVKGPINVILPPPPPPLPPVTGTGGAAEGARAKVNVAAALEGGIDVLSLDQEVTFTQYVRLVLPLDGYVFWVRADLVTISALLNAMQLNRSLLNQAEIINLSAPTLTVKGSLHYSTQVEQNEAETEAVNQVIFTAKEPVQRFNDVQSNILWIADNYGVDDEDFDGPISFAFSARGRYYKAADLFHYVGTAILPTLKTQLIDRLDQFDTSSLIVSNSLPMWLLLSNYTPPYPGFTNYIPLYPSFLVPDNEPPPYGAVHIEGTEALASAPIYDYTLGQLLLCRERVRVTLYGLNNLEVMNFISAVLQYSTDYNTIGMADMPAIVDEKKISIELGAIAKKKTIEFLVNYNQGVSRSVTRQLIEQALVQPTVNPFPVYPAQPWFSR